MRGRCKRIGTALMAVLCIVGFIGVNPVYAADNTTKMENQAEITTDTKTVADAESEKEVVRIGYIDYTGFITATDDGSYAGYGVEYLEKIAEYTGWEYEYVYDSWDNQMQSLLDGKIDFVCHAQKTPEREESYLFSKYSIGSEASVLYVRKDDDRYYYNDFAAFDGMRIAVLANSFQNAEFSEYAQKKGFEFSFATYATQEECFKALDAETVDAVAMGSLALQPNYKVICRFGSDPFYFMSGKENQNFPLTSLIFCFNVLVDKLIGGFPWKKLQVSP